MLFEKDEIHFHNFLEEIRKYRGITIEQLCSGLCSVSQMHYIQSGERLPDYLMRNRIMARLGISSEGYEDYVQFDEYDRWIKRQKLISYIEDSKWSEAARFLYELEKEWKKISKIEQQFLLDMKARILIHEDAGYFEIFEVYEKIVSLTAEGVLKGGRINIFLSQVEYYYVINYLYYKYKAKADDIKKISGELKEIINKILLSPLIGIARAKVLPLAVVKYFEIVQDRTFSFDDVWKYSCEAIEVLKDTERCYYLKELVHLRKIIVSENRKVNDISIEGKAVDIIENLKYEYFFMIPMWQNGYIYRDSQVNCIADVIRARRKMLGIGRKDLSDGICSERTLERIEAKHSKPQQYVMNALFEKLHLVGEYRRTEIITTNIELINRFNKYREEINQKRYDAALESAEYVIRNLDKKYISNKQVLIRLKSLNDLLNNKIDKQRYINNLEKAWRLSIGVDISVSEDCILTNGEVVLLHNILLQKKEKDNRQKVVVDYFKRMSDYTFYSYFSLYELLKDWEASSLGNNGFFQNQTKYPLKYY
ncbi:MAG: hypothetical protein IJJ59_03360 [Pseudobutyrivibrio sp.]|uniref:hypothetical protein n=1 Tax=Pseudobutyrivibrio sp. TaxID=2014367 RepID=UPI0025DA4435|nr:hypothetical protein [Pseudobutyrivibrio sp.]MBQ6462343.1 hypothetical protein [Pseudobutyrivibrio sp.]